MTRQASLSDLQYQMDLAAIDLEDRAVVITMAGAQGIHAFELDSAVAVAVVYEPLDPTVSPSKLELAAPFEIEPQTTWEPDGFVTANLAPTTPALLEDLEAAGRWTWLRGNADALNAAPTSHGLRIETWQLDPDRADLHLIVGCEVLRAYDEDGERPIIPETPPKPPPAAKGHAAPPPEPPFLLTPHEAPAELIEPLEAFFRLHHQGKWRQLAAVWPAVDHDETFRTAWLAAHFIDIHEWGYARAVESFWCEGDLACVQLRGIQHNIEEDTMDPHDAECLWAFSLRKAPNGWTIRNWTQSWPSVGGAPSLPDEAKPWLADWSSGPVDS